jgi:hypothetical protein
MRSTTGAGHRQSLRLVILVRAEVHNEFAPLVNLEELSLSPVRGRGENALSTSATARGSKA